MSKELETTALIIDEVSGILNFLAENFDQTGNTYMYEVLLELSDKLQGCNKSINDFLYIKSSVDITNNIIKNMTNK